MSGLLIDLSTKFSSAASGLATLKDKAKEKFTDLKGMGSELIEEVGNRVKGAVAGSSMSAVTAQQTDAVTRSRTVTQAKAADESEAVVIFKGKKEATFTTIRDSSWEVTYTREEVAAWYDEAIDEEPKKAVEPETATVTVQPQKKSALSEFDLYAHLFTHWAWQDSERASKEAEEIEQFPHKESEIQALISSLNQIGFSLPLDASFIQIADAVQKRRIVLNGMSIELSDICGLVNKRNALIVQKMKCLHKYYSQHQSPIVIHVPEQIEL